MIVTVKISYTGTNMCLGRGHADQSLCSRLLLLPMVQDAINIADS